MNPRREGVQHEHARGHRGPPPSARHHRRRAPGPPEARRRGEARHRLRPRDARRAARDGYRAERARRRRHDRGRDGRVGSLVAPAADASLGAFGTPGRSAPRGAGGVQNEHRRARDDSAAYASARREEDVQKNQNQNASRLFARRGAAAPPEPPRGVRDPRAQGTFGGDGRFCGDGTRLALRQKGTVVPRATPPASADRRTFRRGVSSAVVRQLSPRRRGGGARRLGGVGGEGHRALRLSLPRRPLRQKPTRGTTREDQTPHTPRADRRRAPLCSGAPRERRRALRRRGGYCSLAGRKAAARLAGVALGRDLARSAADALDAEREVATVRLPAVSEGCEAARAKASGGGFAAGACAVRGASRRVDFRDSRARARGSARDVLDFDPRRRRERRRVAV